jgi:starch-binding outer membrane protein, SusD/RagB family
MKKKFLILPHIIFIAIAFIFASCNDIFKVDSVSSVEESNMYRNRGDADAAILGVYSDFLDIADKYVILNEVRADLLESTSNADKELCDINNHTVESGNKYADPRPFYTLILNINDVLKHFAIMHTNSLLTDDEYNQRYSDMVCLRAWVYLQLGIHFGKIPYVTKPFEKVSDLSDESLYPYLELADLIDTLVNEVSNMPYTDPYPTTAENLMGISAGTYTTTPFFINKKMLLGDLYLWQGALKGVLDNSGLYYENAAKCYKDILDDQGSTDQYKLKLPYNEVGTNPPTGIAVGYYYRYQYNDIDGLGDSNTWGWRSIFSRSQDTYYYYEWLWQLFFDVTYGKSSPLIKYFANYGVGEYLLRPTQQSLDYWNAQTQNNGFPFDARRVLSTGTNNGDLICRKYLYEYDESAPYEKWGRLFLYRAAGLYLHYIEAANRAEQCKVALALLNTGIRAEFSPYWSSGIDTIVDLTNYERTDGNYYGLSYPYNFNGRFPQSAQSYTSYFYQGDTVYSSSSKTLAIQIPVGVRGEYCKSIGIRGRAYVKPVLTSMYDIRTKTVAVTDALKDSIENYTIQEDALELAFEGERWGDLLRVAIRRGDPSFIADKVYQKLLKAGNSNAEAVHEKLLKGDYFLPFSLK